jgi:hypothetical protein
MPEELVDIPHYANVVRFPPGVGVLDMCSSLKLPIRLLRPLSVTLQV